MILAGPGLGHGDLRLDFPRIKQAPDEIGAIRQERIRNDMTDLQTKLRHRGVP